MDWTCLCLVAYLGEGREAEGIEGCSPTNPENAGILFPGNAIFGAF